MEIKDEFNPEQIPKEPSLVERKKALAELGRKLADFKKLEIKLQEDLLAAVNQNPDLSTEEIQKKADNLIAESGLSLDQKIRDEISKKIEFYHKTHDIIKKLREQYPDDNDLVSALFGRKPVGKVELKIKPFHIQIDCFNQKDFVYFYYFYPERSTKITYAEKRELKHTIGFVSDTLALPDLNDLVVIMDNTKFEDKIGHRFTEVHEEMHVWHKILDLKVSLNGISEINFDYLMKLYLEGSPCDQEFRDIEGFFVDFRQNNIDQRLTEEMLCHLKQGKEKETVFNLLTSTTGYDYLGTSVKTIREATKDLPQDLKQKIREIADKVFVTQYHKLIQDGIDAFYTLVNDFNYTPSRAAAFLMHETLRDWKKAVNRFRKEEDKRLYGEYKETFDKYSRQS